MRKALAIQHVAFEDLGTLGRALVERGFAIETVEAPCIDWSGLDPLLPDLVVGLGGPIGVYETAAYPFVVDELAFFHARLRAKRPTIGICLGAQFLAAAQGASVHPGANGKEIGWRPLTASAGGRADPLYAGLDGLEVLHWHGDTFDLPAGAAWLAASAAYPNQAFALGTHGLALQFHLEVTAETLQRWYVGHVCELAQAKIDVAALRAESQAKAPALQRFARDFWPAWLDRAGL